MSQLSVAETIDVREKNGDVALPEKKGEPLRTAKEKAEMKVTHLRAKDFVQKKLYAEAAKEYRNLIPLDPRNFKLYSELGRALLSGGYSLQAITPLEKAEKLAGENALCRIALSKAYIGAGLHEKAEKYMRRSVKIDPLNIKYLNLLAGTLAADPEKIADACKIYEKAAKAEPENLRIVTQYTGILVKQNNPGKVLSLLKTFDEKGSEDLAFLTHYGTAQTLKGNYKKAEIYFQKAYKLFPEAAGVLLKLADCANAAKRHSEAAGYYKKFLEKTGADKAKNDLQVLSLQRAGVYGPPEKREKFFAAQRFKHQKPRIFGEQKRVLEQIQEQGYAITDFSKLFGFFDRKLWRAAEAAMSDFVNHPNIKGAAQKISACEDFDQDPEFQKIFKPSILSQTNHIGHLRADHACVALLRHPKILNIANAYYKMFSKLRNVNLWLSPPISETNRQKRKGSQQWHRDQEDQRILKCFIYFSDNDETNGATEYVPQSRCISADKYRNVLPYPASSGYVSPCLFDTKIDPKDRISLNGKKGTIAFLDTNGFHRGGLVTAEKERLLLVSTFLRPSSPFIHRTAKTEFDSAMNTEKWGEAATYALL